MHCNDRRWVLGSSALLILSTCSYGGEALADEVQVTASPILDYEFDQKNGLLTFVDLANRLWVGSVDKATGAFVPPSGQGTLVDINAATARDFGNGPEWVLGSSGGYKIVYTRYLSNQPHSAATANIAKAVQSSSGWKTAYLPNTLGFVEPIGDISPGESDPPIVFRTATTTGGGDGSPLYYQGIGDAMPMPIPNTSHADGSSRLVEDLDLVIYTAPVTDDSGNTNRQVFTYSIGTGTTTQITFDSGKKGDVYMWRAPELGAAWVIFSSINGEDIRYYRQQVDPQTQKPAWVPFQTTNPGNGAPPYIWSPEPFVYKGKSYLFMVRSPSSNPKSFAYPTQIWLSSMDGTINRQLSDPTVADRVRQDPEVFITAQGPFIYYNRYTLTKPGVDHQPDGVWRSDSGLGP